ncbi:Rhamnogal_lyase domain-containing protein [Cephalotus follicularis]|uniref:rhamnogalacturonan endolyase n=1 Tax=Cephalotus follicularis TaxID=3775 RepID=A0A1Q3BYW0_CEPFO|nr:Rhamnogal_lyase domain-containing protein [Cephalotus follicularis]
MENMSRRGKAASFFVWLAMVVLLFFLLTACAEKTPVRKILRDGSKAVPSSLAVQLQSISHEQVVIDNGLVQVTFSRPEGDVIGINYNDIDNVLEARNELNNRGYWDVVWYEPGNIGTYDKLQSTNFTIISQDENQVEVSFSRTWTLSNRGIQVPLNVDKRYIVRRGISGLYVYAIMERLEGWPDVDMDQIRVVFKLKEDMFHYMAISDSRQRIMPMPEDRNTGFALAYPEAVLLTNPTNPELRGEVDDKYQYSCEDKDNRVHGWIASDQGVGFWLITPSDEFRVAGPNKQDLTSHVGPTTLGMFTSTHYAGKEIDTKYRNGEPWKKVFGPVFIYLNSISAQEEEEIPTLWDDAKEQMLLQVESWPYDFIKSDDFPSKEQRGSVSGQLLVHDRYINERNMWAQSAYVGLAPPGDAGSWQRDSKGYQFWTQADNRGNFVIENVRAGNYSLYAWVPGIIGDYKYYNDISITEGCEIVLDILVYEPPRNGPTLWEIGYPDRTAAEYFVPDPYPTLMNQLYNDQADKFRQYGLWERYADIYRHNDLIFLVGVDDYSQHWFYAHVTRNKGNKTYQATTWQIKFDLENLFNFGNYTLQLALASATDSELQVRFNDEKAYPAHFTTGLIGKDNAIARHGIHGLYRLYCIEVPSYQLHNGNNTIYLTQSRALGTFQGVMYDYIRFEGPTET